MERHPLKVLHVITRLIVGGAQENTVLSCALVDRERFPSLIAAGPQTGPEGQLFDEAYRRGVETVIVRHLRREVSPPHDLMVLRELSGLIDRVQPDVVHTHSSKAGIVGRFVARRKRIRAIVHTVHGWSFHDQQPPPVRAAYVRLERRAAEWADKLIVVSERDLETGLRENIASGPRYELIRSGIELDQFTPGGPRGRLRKELGLPADVPVVGSVMRLSPQKDPATFVHAAAALAPHSRAHFVVVGDGPLRDDIRELVCSAGLRDRFHFTGLRRDVPHLLRDFDVFVLTSLWEGLPRTVVQAMASGVPVVGAAVNGVEDLVADGQTGLIVPPADPRATAAAIARLLEDTATARALAQAARTAVQPFDAVNMVSRLEEVYDRLAHAGTR